MEPQGPDRLSALMGLGLVCREIGELRTAEEHLLQALSEVAGGHGLAPVMKGSIHYNLALTYRHKHDYALAEMHYRQAITQFTSERMDNLLTQASQNLAWVFSLTGRALDAVDLLNSVNHLATGDQAWTQRLGFAFTTYADGAHVEALELCQDIIDSAAPANVRAQALWIAGRSSLALSNVAAAIDLAHQALFHAEGNDHRIAQECHGCCRIAGGHDPPSQARWFR
jgi:tetratricopeptide (TPR) repeat protein